MKAFIVLSLISTFFSCQKETNIDINRSKILGRNFTNNEIKSIEIIKIEHPMLGGILSIKKLTKKEQKDFLKNFDKLKQKGLYKCFSNYVIRLNTQKDTLRLKVCGSLVSNRKSDMYYELESNRSLIEKYIK